MRDIYNMSYIKIHNIILSPFGFLKPGSFYNSNSYGLRLITKAQLGILPNGTKLFSINGNIKVIGIDYINDDTRGSYISCGFKTNDKGDLLNENNRAIKPRVP